MISRVFAFLSAAASAFFLYVYYERYFRWIDCFNELGRCYDSETKMVYLEQAGIIWMMMAIIFLVLATLLFLKSRSRQKR